MNCQACNNPMVKVHGQDHHHCRGCNKFEFKSDIQNSQIPILPQGTATEFQCPKCVLPLEVGLIHANMQVCFCNNCRGFVTPSQSLGVLISELRSAYTGPDDQPVPINSDELEIFDNCPACWEKMDSHPYYGPGNVVLNTCMHCKLAWLDHGELDKIARAPGPRPNQKPAGNFESKVLRNQLQVQADSGLFNFFM